MANGVEHLNAVMELLPHVRLSIVDDDARCASDAAQALSGDEQEVRW